jgi:nucleotidyltransferase/DNA polymerase involved in DNA repair
MAEPEDSKPVACTRPDSPSAFLFDTKYLAKKYGVPEGLSKRQTKKLIKKHKKEEYKAEWR